jgi:hypothetical protein
MQQIEPKDLLAVAEQLEPAVQPGSQFDADKLVIMRPQGLEEIRAGLLGLSSNFDLSSSIDFAVTQALRHGATEVTLETGALLSRVALNPREDRDDRIEAFEGLQRLSSPLSRQIGYAATHHPDTEEQAFALSILLDLNPGVALTRSIEIREQAMDGKIPEELIAEIGAIIQNTEVSPEILHRNCILAAEALNDGTLLPQARFEKVLDIQETDRELAAAILTALTRTGDDTLGQRSMDQKLHLLALDHLSGLDLGLAVAIAPTLPEISTPNSFPDRLIRGFSPLV